MTVVITTGVKPIIGKSRLAEERVRQAAEIYASHGGKVRVARVVMGIFSSEKSVRRSSTCTSSQDRNRITNSKEIQKIESSIRTYIFEAIEVEKQGLEVEMKKTSEFEMPIEFKQELEKNSDLKKAFNLLTPGRQRGYLLYFSGAKQSKTRSSRINKLKEKILSGKGLND